MQESRIRNQESRTQSTKTSVTKPTDINRAWFIVDAKGQVLGRLASEVAGLLRGKNKANFTPNLDCGDFVIVINAAKVKVTGNKLESKNYYRHSGYPGGIKSRTLAEQLERDPGFVIEHAVMGMLPKNKLADKMIKKLKVYADDNHQHEAQKPVEYKLEG
mgnify:CR=1 FL=1